MPKADYYRALANGYNSDTQDVLNLIDECARAGEYEMQAHLTNITRAQLIKLGFDLFPAKDKNSPGDLFTISWK